MPRIRTNGRVYATVLRPSVAVVCTLCIYVIYLQRLNFNWTALW